MAHTERAASRREVTIDTKEIEGGVYQANPLARYAKNDLFSTFDNAEFTLFELKEKRYIHNINGLLQIQLN